MFIFFAIKVIEYLHFRQIAHKDISLENILVTNENQFLLHDFGYLQKFSGKQTNTTEWSGKPEYMSPEVPFFVAMCNNHAIFLLHCFFCDCILFVRFVVFGITE